MNIKHKDTESLVNKPMVDSWIQVSENSEIINVFEGLKTIAEVNSSKYLGVFINK